MWRRRVPIECIIVDGRNLKRPPVYFDYITQCLAVDTIKSLWKEEKENLNWIVKEGHTLKNKQKNEILQIYKKQRLLNDMYGKDEGFKGIIKGIFKLEKTSIIKKHTAFSFSGTPRFP